MFLYSTLNSRFFILSQKLQTNRRIIFFSSIERFKAILNLECFFVSRRSVRLKLKLFYENFFVDSLFVLLVNVTYFEDQNKNSQHGICKTLWSHASGSSAMLSIEAFSLGNELVHVQAVPGSSIDSPVVTQWWNTLTTEAIGNSRRMGLVNYIFFKGKNPVFLKNHYLLNFWNLYSLASSLYGVIVKLHWEYDEILKLVSTWQ